MDEIRNVLAQNYIGILESLDKFIKENDFQSKPLEIRTLDKTLLIFDTLYHLIENIKSIRTNTQVIKSLYYFEDYLPQGRLQSLIYKALSSGANLSKFDDIDFDKLVSFGDKDILIQLAKSEYINDDIARKLIKPIYLVLDYLLSNKEVSSVIKKEIFIFIKEQNSETLNKLIKKYKN